MAGTFYGYPFLDSLFESTSAAANVGLSCGVTSVGMPNGLKVFYIFQMWAGRLEFLSIFTLAGFIFAVFRGRK
jgi:trk system potassium uptake protein TrkH